MPAVMVLGVHETDGVGRQCGDAAPIAAAPASPHGEGGLIRAVIIPVEHYLRACGTVGNQSGRRLRRQEQEVDRLGEPTAAGAD